ncbi:MAG TPA: hypothetical protein VGM88_08720 [Kofleriaceae bacterium]|jgi:hypothetical protein
MAIDYVLAAPCVPQETLGVERLVELSRMRSMARTILAMREAEGDTRPADQIQVQFAIRRLGEDANDRGTTVAELLAETAPLDEVAPHCATCPAGMPRELACHQRIRYPIPEHVEQWLIGRLPESLGCTAGTFLVRALREFGWDGAPVERMRAAGTTFFESRVAYGVRWEAPDGDKIELSTDTLFQMMFHVGPLQPTHALMLALFLGVLPHDLDLGALRDDTARRAALQAARVTPTGDQDIEQLANFLRLLPHAALVELPILIDG